MRSVRAVGRPAACTLGPGAPATVGKVDIVFDARYDLGLTDALELGSSKMSAFQFLAGVAFPLGK